MLRMRNVLVAAGVLALGLTACTSTATPSTTPAATGASQTAAKDPLTKGDGTKTIYLVSKGFQHRFWQAVKEGAEQGGKEFGYKVEFVGPANEKAVNEQLGQLETALASNPAAIGFAALDSAAAGPVLNKIKAANIPVIAFDSGVESDIPLTTVQTNNTAAAAEAAKHLAELVGKKGKVALVCHDNTSQTGKQRCEGFKEYMKTNAPDITVLPEVIAGEVGEAANAAKNTLQANPDVVGIYGTNEAAAIGALQGVTEAGKASSIKIVGFDSGKAQIDAIKAGTEAGAVTQSPVKMGYETVKAAVMAINGAKLDKVIDSGFAWYDKTNIDSDAIKPNLYE